MTSPRPSEDPVIREKAMKSRIINHMNADHASSLRLYLQHYNKMSASQTQSVQLEDITLDHLLISSSDQPSLSSTNKTRSFIPIDPPMKAYSEARERMVSMHQTSLSGLGLSDLQINEYAPPNRIWQYSLLTLCIWVFATTPFPQYITPEVNGIMYKGWSVFGLFPSLAYAAHKLAYPTLTFVVVVHGIETWILARTRLRKYQVPRGSGVWWAWVLNTFVTGFGAFARFDDLVREKEEAKKKEKH